MKKIISLIFLSSIFICSSSILAMGSENLVAKDQQKDSNKDNIVSMKNKSLENQVNPFIDKFKTGLIAALATGAVAGSAYLAYKLSGKIGLNKEIKDVSLSALAGLKGILSSINKTRVLKKLLIGGAIIGTLNVCLMVYMIHSIINEGARVCGLAIFEGLKPLIAAPLVVSVVTPAIVMTGGMGSVGPGLDRMFK